MDQVKHESDSVYVALLAIGHAPIFESFTVVQSKEREGYINGLRMIAQVENVARK